MRHQKMMTLFSVMASALLSLVIVSCAGPSTGTASAPFKAQVVVFKSADSPEGGVHFALETREFKTLRDLDKLNGDYVRLYRGGKLVIKEVSGSIVQSENFSGGQSPDLRYRVEDGVVVARDYSTLVMLSAYYQLDTIFSNLEATVGVKPADLLATLKVAKIDVLFEPQLEFSSSGSDTSAAIKLNAAFVPTAKQFVLFQRSPLENIPLAANLQVLSHEFGHAIFDYSFYNGISDEKNRFAKEYAISGLNEGFADTDSFSFTGSANILRGSIDIASIADERNFVKTTFTYDDITRDDTSKDAVCSGSFYCIGTIFARALYKTRVELGTVTQLELMNTLIGALKTTKAGLEAQTDKTILPADETENMDKLTTTEAYEYDGKVVGAFLNTLIPKMPAAWKTALCTNFENEFGTKGFPEAARTGACN